VITFAVFRVKDDVDPAVRAALEVPSVNAFGAAVPVIRVIDCPSVGALILTFPAAVAPIFPELVRLIEAVPVVVAVIFPDVTPHATVPTLGLAPPVILEPPPLPEELIVSVFANESVTILTLDPGTNVIWPLVRGSGGVCPWTVSPVIPVFR